MIRRPHLLAVSGRPGVRDNKTGNHSHPAPLPPLDTPLELHPDLLTKNVPGLPTPSCCCPSSGLSIRTTRPQRGHAGRRIPATPAVWSIDQRDERPDSGDIKRHIDLLIT